MAKVQLLHRLRLVPSPAVIAPPTPAPKPIAPVQDADRRALSFPRGPAPGARRTPEYSREVARFDYFWAWPLVNVFNRYRVPQDQAPHPGRRHRPGRPDQPSRHAA